MARWNLDCNIIEESSSSSSSDNNELHISWESSSDTEHETVNQQKVVTKPGFDSFKRLNEEFSVNSVNLFRKKLKKCNEKQASFIGGESSVDNVEHSHNSIDNVNFYNDVSDENIFKIEEVSTPEFNNNCKSREARQLDIIDRKNDNGTGASRLSIVRDITFHDRLKNGNTFVNHKSSEISDTLLRQKIITKCKRKEITSQELNISSCSSFSAVKKDVYKENKEIGYLSPVLNIYTDQQTTQNYQHKEGIVELERSPVLKCRNSNIIEINNLETKSPEFRKHRKQECLEENVSEIAKSSILSRKNSATVVENAVLKETSPLFESKCMSKRDESSLVSTGIHSFSKRQVRSKSSTLEENNNTVVSVAVVEMSGACDANNQLKSSVQFKSAYRITQDSKESNVGVPKSRQTFEKSSVLSNKKQRYVSDTKYKTTPILKHSKMLRKDLNRNPEKCSLQDSQGITESHIKNIKDLEPKRLKLQEEMMKLVNTPIRNQTGKRSLNRKRKTGKSGSESYQFDFPINFPTTPQSEANSQDSCRQKLTEWIEKLETIQNDGGILCKNIQDIKSKLETTFCEKSEATVHKSSSGIVTEVLNLAEVENISSCETGLKNICQRKTQGKCNANHDSHISSNTSKISEYFEFSEEEPLSSQPPCIESVSSQEMKSTTQEDSEYSTSHISPVCTQQMVVNKHVPSQDTSSTTSTGTVNANTHKDSVDMDSAREKFKRSSLAERLQKALAKQKSASNILQYESNVLAGCSTVNRRWNNVFFTVQQSWIEHGRYILKCSPLPQTGDDGEQKSKSSSIDINIQSDDILPPTVSECPCNGVSDSRDCLLLLNSDIVRLPKFERNTILNVFPPWEWIDVPRLGMKLMLSITYVEVVHSAGAVSNTSPIQYTRILRQYSCSCMKAHRWLKGCTFKLPDNGREIVEAMFSSPHKKDQYSLTQVSNDLKDGTIISAIDNIKKGKTDSVYLLITVDKIFRYKEMRIILKDIAITQGDKPENLVWAVFGHDVNDDYCEIILGSYPDEDKFVVTYNNDKREHLSQLSQFFCSSTEDNNGSTGSDLWKFSSSWNDPLEKVQNSDISQHLDTNRNLTCFAVCRSVVGKMLRIDGLIFAKKNPYSIIPEYIPFLSTSKNVHAETGEVNNNKKLNEEGKFLYEFSPVPGMLSLRQNDAGDLNLPPKSPPDRISLSQALTLCQGNERLRCSLLCVLIFFSEDRLYVIDESLSNDYVSVCVEMFCYVPQQVSNNRTSIILLEDIKGYCGRLFADKYSWIIPYDKASQLYEDQLKNLSNLKPKILSLMPSSLEKTLVELSGNIVGLDEDTAYEWAVCAVCGEEELEEVHTGRYFCDRCLKVVEVHMKRSLTVTISSPQVPVREIKVELLQVSIDRLLGQSVSGQNEYDPMFMLGQQIGPLLCLVTKSENFGAQRIFYLREVTQAGIKG